MFNQVANRYLTLKLVLFDSAYFSIRWVPLPEGLQQPSFYGKKAGDIISFTPMRKNNVP